MSQNLTRFEVNGLENGGADLFCLDCEEWVAGGGCVCCSGQEVKLAQLVKAAQDHLCPPRKDMGDG